MSLSEPDDNKFTKNLNKLRDVLEESLKDDDEDLEEILNFSGIEFMLSEIRR